MIDYPNIPGIPGLRKGAQKMTKPHVVLRTHDGIPTPPAWSSQHSIVRRDEIRGNFKRLNKPNTQLNMWDWSITGHAGDIVAVEWLK